MGHHKDKLYSTKFISCRVGEVIVYKMLEKAPCHPRHVQVADAQ